MFRVARVATPEVLDTEDQVEVIESVLRGDLPAAFL